MQSAVLIRTILTALAALAGGAAYKGAGDAGVPAEAIAALTTLSGLAFGWAHLSKPTVQRIKAGVFILGSALGAVAAACATMGAASGWGGALGLVSGVLVGWSGITKPGDAKAPGVPSAPLWLLLPFVLAASLELEACAGSALRTDWPKILQCASGEVPGVIGEVSRILLNDRAGQTVIGGEAKQELLDLAVTKGTDVVACAVQQLIASWRAPSPGGARADELLYAADRGEDFLQGQGTTVVLR